MAQTFDQKFAYNKDADLQSIKLQQQVDMYKMAMDTMHNINIAKSPEELAKEKYDRIKKEILYNLDLDVVQKLIKKHMPEACI